MQAEAVAAGWSAEALAAVFDEFVTRNRASGWQSADWLAEWRLYLSKRKPKTGTAAGTSTRCAITGRRIPDLEQIRSWVFGGGFEKSEPMPHPIAGLMRKKFVLGNADIDGFDECYQRLVERFISGNPPDYPASWNTSS